MKNNCKDCLAFQSCRDSATAWVFLFIGLIATLAIRIVNFLLAVSPFWAKFSWYIGIAGFLVYFLYKFKQDRLLQEQLRKMHLTEKLIQKEALIDAEYLFLNNLICKLKSRKDTLNYFFIFFTSLLALLIGIYQDFIKR